MKQGCRFSCQGLGISPTDMAPRSQATDDLPPSPARRASVASFVLVFVAWPPGGLFICVAEKSRNPNMQRFNWRALIIRLSEA